MEAIIKTSDKKIFDAILKVLEGLNIEVTFKENSKDFLTNSKSGYDFFKSAGMWKNRKISAQSLRKQAWRKAK